MQVLDIQFSLRVLKILNRKFVPSQDIPQLHATLATCYNDFIEVSCRMQKGGSREAWIESDICYKFCTEI